MSRTFSRSGLLFADFVHEDYLPYIQQRKRGWVNEERAIRRYIMPEFGKRVFVRISRNDIENWLGGLPGKGLKASSCNRIFSMVRAIFSFAVRRGIMLLSPCATIRPLPQKTPRERFLTKKEANLLLAHLTQRNTTGANALRLLLLTGARKSEILQAKWEHVDFVQSSLLVPLSKTGRPRHIILSKAACALLACLPSRGNSEWLFPGRDNTHAIRDIFGYWQKTRRELGLEDVRIHDLRHTYASLLVAQGHTLYEVQRLLGHNDPRTTTRYAHFENSTLKAVADSVGTFLGSGPRNIFVRGAARHATAGKVLVRRKNGGRMKKMEW